MSHRSHSSRASTTRSTRERVTQGEFASLQFQVIILEYLQHKLTVTLSRIAVPQIFPAARTINIYNTCTIHVGDISDLLRQHDVRALGRKNGGAGEPLVNTHQVFTVPLSPRRTATINPMTMEQPSAPNPLPSAIPSTNTRGISLKNGTYTITVSSPRLRDKNPTSDQPCAQATSRSPLSSSLSGVSDKFSPCSVRSALSASSRASGAAASQGTPVSTLPTQSRPRLLFSQRPHLKAVVAPSEWNATSQQRPRPLDDPAQSNRLAADTAARVYPRDASPKQSAVSGRSHLASTGAFGADRVSTPTAISLDVDALPPIDTYPVFDDPQPSPVFRYFSAGEPFVCDVATHVEAEESDNDASDAAAGCGASESSTDADYEDTVADSFSEESDVDNGGAADEHLAYNNVDDTLLPVISVQPPPGHQWTQNQLAWLTVGPLVRFEYDPSYRGLWFTVTKGTHLGVYSNWSEVEPYVAGISNSAHKSRPTWDEAWALYHRAVLRGKCAFL
ncbi:hypothetical protein EIP91_001978 [Steccherinum ochraceum]|uniref:Ribonuclease H1 N-terminal domain-containing protein n=1 Tax=Steccherinum ochraceum TaxID=92696 RepID=A0A4R0RQ64_9APHY|nr:hypothetical protein EIP91_001978 [Steccherinum ochraceum]